MAYRLWQQKQSRMQFGEKLTVSAATEKFGLTKQEKGRKTAHRQGSQAVEVCHGSPES